jgi:hypothetical protein
MDIIVLHLRFISSIGKCALDANKQKDAPNGKAAISGLSSLELVVAINKL